MTIAKIILKNEVACSINGLDLDTRKKLSEKYSFFVPHARYSPSFKLGRWDGKINFFSIGGSTYNNLLEEIVPDLIQSGYEVDIEDNRVAANIGTLEPVERNTFAHIIWPEGHPFEGKPVELHDHQINAINQYLENPQCIQELSTSAGKTIITAALSQRIEKYGRSIVIVPNKSLVEQTLADYENFELDVGVYYGDRKDLDKTHTICTWQSLESLERQKRDEKRSDAVEEFVSGVCCVIVDEVHGADAAALKRLLSGPMANIPLRWGLTGTIPKDQGSQMSIKVNLGPIVNKVKASDLQELGILSSCNINVLQTQENIIYSNYQSELSFLVTDPVRLDWMAEKIKEISCSGNTLVLVDRIKTGEELVARIEDSVFVSGEVKQKKRKEEYKDINLGEGKILVATFGVAAVGISITRLHNVVLIEPGKSFVRVIQSIGRGLRKGFDKDHVNIWDVCANAKYSKKHLTERKRFYSDAEYPFTIKKIYR
jgi:superfamily II DNA or RNA helicase